MKRLGRSMFSMLAALSLVLCVATVALWVRSYWVCDSVERTFLPEKRFECKSVGLASSRGGLLFESNFWHAYYFGAIVEHRPVNRWVHEPARPYPRWIAVKKLGGDTFIVHDFHALGFEVAGVVVSDGGDTHPRERCTFVVVPLPAIAIVTALLPVYAFRRRARRRRAKEGCCLACGYDLRATPDRCPECGTVPEKAAGGMTKPETRDPNQ